METQGKRNPALNRRDLGGGGEGEGGKKGKFRAA